MRTAVLRAPGEFVIQDAPVPVPGPREVLVRVAACGVCASELDIWEGSGNLRFPLSIGHEVSGTVVDTGAEVTGVGVGDPVAVWTTGRGFAEYVAVPADHCRPAAGVPLEEALAEPLACAVNAVDAADVRLGDDVLVIGAGFMGLLVQQLVTLRGARHVVVADARTDALERAAGLGATRVVDVRSESLPDVVADATAGRGVDVSFEVTGAQAPLEMLGRTTRMSGTVALVGYHQGEARRIPLGQWNWMAFRIVNGHVRDPATILRGMTAGMRLLTSGRIRMHGLVTHRYPLERIGEAFRTARDKPVGFVKSTVVLDGTAP